MSGVGGLAAADSSMSRVGVDGVRKSATFPQKINNPMRLNLSNLREMVWFHSCS